MDTLSHVVCSVGGTGLKKTFTKGAEVICALFMCTLPRSSIVITSNKSHPHHHENSQAMRSRGGKRGVQNALRPKKPDHVSTIINKEACLKGPLRGSEEVCTPALCAAWLTNRIRHSAAQTQAPGPGHQAPSPRPCPKTERRECEPELGA